MANSSFDEHIIITNPKIIEELHKDLDDPTPVKYERKSNVPILTMKQCKKNAKKLKKYFKIKEI